MVPIAVAAFKTVVGESIIRAFSKKARQSPPPETKGLLQSKTVQGVALLGFSGQLAGMAAPVLAAVAGWAGYDLDATAAAGILNGVFAAAGALWAVWGRIKATKRIGAK